jgi:hypothetical protein
MGHGRRQPVREASRSGGNGASDPSPERHNVVRGRSSSGRARGRSARRSVQPASSIPRLKARVRASSASILGSYAQGSFRHLARASALLSNPSAVSLSAAIRSLT